MKKKKQTTVLNSDFEKCKKCIYFPDISVSTHDYYVDENGVKHRDIHYICRYDFHEIYARTNKCMKESNELNGSI